MKTAFRKGRGLFLLRYRDAAGNTGKGLYYIVAFLKLQYKNCEFSLYY